MKLQVFALSILLFSQSVFPQSVQHTAYDADNQYLLESGNYDQLSDTIEFKNANIFLQNGNFSTTTLISNSCPVNKDGSFLYTAYDYSKNKIVAILKCDKNNCKLIY